jgi:hypothetical protein
MDAALLFKLASCEKARYFYAKKIMGKATEQSIETILPKQRSELLRYFNACDIHPISYTKQQFQQFSAPIDRLRANINGFELSKIVLASCVPSFAIKELALSVWVLRQKFMNVNKTYIYNINSRYIRKGKINFEKLLIKNDVTKSVFAKVRRIDEIVPSLDAEPSNPRKAYCPLDQNCQYAHICLANIPKYSTLNVATLHKEIKHILLRQGIKNPKNIPSSLLNRYQQIQINCDRTKQSHIEYEKIKDFMTAIKYPVHFVDFEAINYAIPLFDRTKAFEPIPFQYSAHILNSPSSRPKHYELLLPSDRDPREIIANDICRLIGAEGSIVAYGSQLEIMILKKLAELYPTLTDKLESIIVRTIDLMIPFEQRWFYNYKMRGRHSLKHVARAMDTKLRYSTTIKNGFEAVKSYLQLSACATAESKAISAELLDYCKKDSLYLLKIFRKLHVIAHNHKQ